MLAFVAPFFPSAVQFFTYAYTNPFTSGTSSDQTLENIKMAYYWAGYYSGLYEGQRQAQQQATAGHGQTAAPGQGPEQTQIPGLE